MPPNKVNIQIGLTDKPEDAIVHINGNDIGPEGVSYLFFELIGGERIVWVVSYGIEITLKQKIIRWLIERLKE